VCYSGLATLLFDHLDHLRQLYQPATVTTNTPTMLAPMYPKLSDAYDHIV
jgi:hypothetical protein